MNDEDEKMEMYRYKYIPKNVELTIDKNYPYRDGVISYLTIIHDYTRRRMPVIQCGMEMEAEVITAIYKYKDSSKLKLDIYEQQLDKDGNIINTALYLQHIFTIIPARDQSAYITVEDYNGKEIMEVTRTVQEFEMYLIDMDVVNWFTQEISLVLSNVNHGAALQALFVERGIPGKTVIATPPMQNGTVAQMVIPLEDLVHNIYHLNNTYGLYDGIPIIYWDMDKLYCVAKKTPNIKIPSATEYTNVTFILKDPDLAEHDVSGSYNDNETETHWINLRHQPDIYDDTIQDNSAKFATLTTVNGDGKVSKTTRDGTNATTVKYIYSQNSLTESQLMNESIYGHVLNVTATDASIRFIKPYKDYTFECGESFRELKLSGHIYRLTQLTLAITKDKVNDYMSDVSLVLYNPTRESDSSGNLSPSNI